MVSDSSRPRPKTPPPTPVPTLEKCLRGFVSSATRTLAHLRLVMVPVVEPYNGELTSAADSDRDRKPGFPPAPRCRPGAPRRGVPGLRDLSPRARHGSSRRRAAPCRPAHRASAGRSPPGWPGRQAVRPHGCVLGGTLADARDRFVPSSPIPRGHHLLTREGRRVDFSVHSLG